MEWKCPFCNHDTTILPSNCSYSNLDLQKDNADGLRVAYTQFIICPNPKCHKISLSVSLYKGLHVPTQNNLSKGSLLDKWVLIPPSQAKIYPEYIPLAIRNDYTEAHLIKDLSPKASATLSRRCLQGMIRHFWDVKKGRLVDEIEAIKDKTDPDTWNAINSVREIGNIGAHMEKDIDLIIEVDPNEAEILLQLIEMLLQDWYIARHEKRAMLENIVNIANEKSVAREKKK